MQANWHATFLLNLQFVNFIIIKLDIIILNNKLI